MYTRIILLVAIAVSSVYSNNGTSSGVVPTPSSSMVSTPTSSMSVTPSPSSASANMSMSIHPTNMSSSAAVMSPSVAPITPAPVPPSTDVSFTYPKTGDSCVAMNGTVSFTVSYNNSHTNKIDQVMVHLTRKNVTVTGVCHEGKNNMSSIMVKWGTFYSFALHFTFDSNKEWFLAEIKFSATAKDNKAFPNATKATYDATKNFNESENGGYHATSNHSYMCDTKANVKLSDDVMVDFESIRIQPFTMKHGAGYAKADMCPSGDSSPKPNSLVPIIVGCALAGLIVIVLIAYLVGRRKSSRGYQQV